MNLLVLTLAVSNIFNWNGNKDVALEPGEVHTEFPTFPRKCCDVMELKVPGKEPEEFRFYKAQDAYGHFCDIDTDDEMILQQQFSSCDIVVPGFLLFEPIVWSDFSFKTPLSKFIYYNNSQLEEILSFFPGTELKDAIYYWPADKGLPELIFANFECGSNEAVLIKNPEMQRQTEFTKIDASISCKGEEDSDYTWVIVGSLLGILVVGLLIWAKLRAQRSSLETPFL